MGVAIDPTCIYIERLQRSANDKKAYGRDFNILVKKLECLLNEPSGE